MKSVFLSLLAASTFVWTAFAGPAPVAPFSFRYPPLGKVLDVPGEFRAVGMRQNPMVFSSDASTLAVFGEYPRSIKYRVRLLSLTGEQPNWISSELDTIEFKEAAAFSREKDLVAINRGNGIEFWSIRDGTRRKDLKALTCPGGVSDSYGPFDRDRPFKPIFLDNGKKLLANCGSRWSAVWDVQSGKVLSAFVGQGDSLNPQRVAAKAPVVIHPILNSWDKPPFPNVGDVSTTRSDLKVYLHSDIAKIITELAHQEITVLDAVLSDDGNEVGVTYTVDDTRNAEHKVGLLRLAQRAWAPLRERAEIVSLRYVKTSPYYEKPDKGEYHFVTTEGTSSNLRYNEIGSFMLFEQNPWYQSIAIYNRNFGSLFGNLSAFYLDPELRWLLSARNDGTVEVVDLHQINEVSNAARGIFTTLSSSCLAHPEKTNASGIEAMAVDLKNEVIAISDSRAFDTRQICAPIRIIRLGSRAK